MLDRALRLTFRYMTTFLLLVGALSLPLHAAYGLIFRDVLALREIHADIDAFPEGREVRGVSAADLDGARAVFAGMELAEVLVALFLVGACRHVIDVGEAGGDPGVKDSLRHLGPPRRQDLSNPQGPGLATIGAGIGIALFVGLLTERLGYILIEPLADQDAWAGLALVRASARALAAPFALVPLALAHRAAKEQTGVAPT